MAELMDRIGTWMWFLPRISLSNLVEIIIITIVIYEVLLWIMNTRAWTLLKGLAVILAFTLFAAVFQLRTILWILERTATIAATALLVIFQPELRKALEQLGSQKIITNILSFDDGKENNEFSERTVNEIVRATFEMAKVKTGALMVIEQNDSLKEIERTGIQINGLISSQLLINIFEHNTPLHDGAVVLRGNRVTAATCYLPLSDNNEHQQRFRNPPPGGSRNLRDQRQPDDRCFRGDGKGQRCTGRKTDEDQRWGGPSKRSLQAQR